MGWSCTSVASRVLDRFDERNRQAGATTSNGWTDPDGRRYFYETSRRDQADGGIAGTWHEIYAMNGTDYCRKRGTFRIAGDGSFVRGPRGMREAAKG